MIDGLVADVVVRRPGFELDVSLRVPAGATLAVVGPNGAGKTTLLRALAGLVALSDGQIRVGGRVLDDVAAGVRVPVEARRLGMVFQEHLLFPHLSALDNVAFGPRCAGASRAGARRLAVDWLERVGLAELAAARPRELSGGQGQRVALARALVGDPALLLLDEPLSALDAATRLDVRAELRRHLRAFGGVSVLVTHEPLDALVLGDRLVVIEHGRVVQDGTPAEVARHPRTDYVARLVGLNLLRGRVDGGRVRLGSGAVVVPAALPGDPVEAPGAVLPATSGEVLVAVPPGAIALHLGRPEGSARNIWPAVVDGLVVRGDQVRVSLRGDVPLLVDVTAAAVAELRLAPGTPVWAAVKAQEVACYPA